MAEAVESVVLQTYSNWELLLVDDGSTDRSAALANAFTEQYPDSVRYFAHPNHANRGLSASRNLGIAQARGDLIAFLDADDVWLPGKLTQQVAIMEEHRAVALLCEASEYWFSWTDPDRADVAQPVGVAPGSVYEPPRLLLDLYPLGRGAAPCPSGLMVRKSLLGNRYFEESFRGMYALYEDQAFLSKVYLHQPVYVSSACTNRYRQRAGSIVQAVHESGQYHQVRTVYLDWLARYLTEHGFSNRKVWRSLWKARLPYRYPRLYPVVHKVLVKLRGYLN